MGNHLRSLCSTTHEIPDSPGATFEAYNFTNQLLTPLMELGGTKRLCDIDA
jgi:hypothetical protein